MTRKAFAVVGLLAIAAFALTACGGNQVKDDKPEVLLPGQLVENIDATTDMVKCQGRGPDQKTAIIQARKGCLEWYITEKLAQSPDERNAYLAKQKDIMANLDRYVWDPRPGSPRDGKGEGVKSQVRVDDDTIKIEINTKVFKRQLEMDLVGMGVTKSKDEVLAGAGGTNPTVMVVPSAANKGSKDRNNITQLLTSYLTKNKWEVRSLEGSEELDKLTGAMGESTGAEDDEAATAAAAAGADVYIKFEATKKRDDDRGNVAYLVALEARETTTKRTLAAEKVTGEAYALADAASEGKALDSALNDAMGRIIPQVTDYWREDSAKGSKFWVVFENAPKNTDVAMNGVLKKTCTQVKLEQSTATKAKFFVQCKADGLELVSAIDEGITAKLGGAAYEKNMAKSVIQIVFTK